MSRRGPIITLASVVVLAVIFLFFGLASPVLAKYTPEIVKLAASSIDIHVPTPTIKDAVAQLIKNLSQVGVLTAILLAMGAALTFGVSLYATARAGAVGGGRHGSGGVRAGVTAAHRSRAPPLG